MDSSISRFPVVVRDVPDHDCLRECVGSSISSVIIEDDVVASRLCPWGLCRLHHQCCCILGGKCNKVVMECPCDLPHRNLVNPKSSFQQT